MSSDKNSEHTGILNLSILQINTTCDNDIEIFLVIEEFNLLSITLSTYKKRLFIKKYFEDFVTFIRINKYKHAY
jgi:hypothetical protein